MVDETFQKTARLRLGFNKRGGDLQDGMLAYYLDQAPLADANIEARIEREPFDFRWVSSSPIMTLPTTAVAPQKARITPKCRRELGNL